MKINQKKWRDEIRPTTDWYKEQRQAEHEKVIRKPKPTGLTPWMLEGMRKNNRLIT